MRSFEAALLLVLAPFSSAAAQSTNVSLYQEMAVECLGELPAADSVVLEAPQQMPYVRSALVAAWQAAGREVFVDGADGDGVRVAYDVEEADVTYSRSSRQLARSVRLTLRYTVTSTDGRILADDRCSDSRSDRIAQDDVEAVQSEAFTETQGDLPQGRWLRRVVEPAVITAATAVAVYLFFALRSSSGDGS